jgi:ubiquinone/menaquinone biosynthesis C-methylase UbiE
MAINNFDFIAPVYDRLARLVFGKSILRAQRVHLPEIQPKDRVLILGGGTGQLLEHIPLCEQIVFIDKSKRMVKSAKKRMVNRSIDFISADFLTYESGEKYNVIICPFFMDCFSKKSLEAVIEKCRLALKNDGRLIVTDFESGRINLTLLKSMLLFFRFFSNLEAKKLLDIRNMLKTDGLMEKDIKLFKKGIFSAIYTQELRK